MQLQNGTETSKEDQPEDVDDVVIEEDLKAGIIGNACDTGFTR